MEKRRTFQCSKQNASIVKYVSDTNPNLTIIFQDKCGFASTRKPGATSHEGGTFCTGCNGSQSALHEIFAYAEECATQQEDGQLSAGLEVEKGPGGEVVMIKITREFRTREEVMMMTARVFSRNSFYRAVEGSKEWQLFVITALGDGVDKYLPRRYEFVIDMIKTLCIGGVGVLGLLDAETAKRLFANVVGEIDTLRGVVDNVGTEMVGRLADAYARGPPPRTYGHAYQPPACCTSQGRRATCPEGPRIVRTEGVTFTGLGRAVRTYQPLGEPAPGVPYRTCHVPWHHRSACRRSSSSRRRAWRSCASGTTRWPAGRT